MSEKKTLKYSDFVLPANLVTKIDISRVVTELEWADNELTSMTIRKKTGVKKQVEPVLSEQASEFLDVNTLDFGDAKVRAALIKQLHLLKNNVPTIHLTFAVPADGASLEKLAGWVRTAVHPQAVIEVGLQPALIGGVYVRTANHVHDWSMRAKLAENRGLITKELEALRGAK